MLPLQTGGTTVLIIMSSLEVKRSRSFFVRARKRLLQAFTAWMAIAFCAPAASAADQTGFQGAPQIIPAAIALEGTADRHGALIQAPDGTDISRKARLWSSNPNIFVVDTNRLCAPVGDGRAELLVEWEGVTNSIQVTVARGRDKPVPSFRRDIEPILTRQGCNMGACHGKLAGQNGFKLSLRGYAPEMDYRWLTTDVTGRRVNPAFPDESLLIQKPLGTVPHEGGVRFAPGTRYHQALADWVAARAPYTPPGVNPDQEPEPLRIELLPGDRIARPGDTRQLLARAAWSDGRVTDVTWVTQFFSNNESTATVSRDGLVKVQRAGEATIRAHFLGLVATVQITAPQTNAIEEWRFARRQNGVDDAVFAKLAALRIPPSPSTDDLTFFRRAMLDTLGTLPTPEEVRAFAADSDPKKRERLVDSLFQRPEFVDYWALQLADLLQNRKERDHDVRGSKNVRAFHAWIRHEVEVNRPWNELVREILTATGDSVSHPEIGYYIYLVGEKQSTESEVTDSVAQAFLGTRIGCARCHNHPLEKYTQDDFYHFAAFFNRVSMDRKDPGEGLTELSVESRDERDRGRQLTEARATVAEAQSKLLTAEGSATNEARRTYSDRQREVAERKRELDEARSRLPVAYQPRTHREVEARALDRAKVDWQTGDDPRTRLADWITSTNNPYFAQAIVNRLWKHFLGTGLVEPVDDLRASNPPSNPALMDLLARELVSSGYDLRAVMRLILNSGVYQLSSSTLPGNETETRFYSHYYARRLPSEVIADAVSAATGVPDKFDGFPVGIKAVQLPEPSVSSYFLTLFGRSERVTACACERNGEVTLPQLLNLQNGGEIQRKLESSENRLHAITTRKLGPVGAVEDLYLATFNRPPTEAETAKCLSILGSEKPEKGLPDLFWALLNSKEFSFNH